MSQLQLGVEYTTLKYQNIIETENDIMGTSHLLFIQKMFYELSRQTDGLNVITQVLFFWGGVWRQGFSV